jgi:hypothetical protein
MSKEPQREKIPETRKQPAREPPVNDQPQDRAGLPPEIKEPPPEESEGDDEQDEP